MLLKRESNFRQYKFISGMTVRKTYLYEWARSCSSRQDANKIKVYMNKNIYIENLFSFAKDLRMINRECAIMAQLNTNIFGSKFYK